ISRAGLLFLVGIHEQLIFVPGYFASAHPEWRDFHLMLRPLVRFAIRLTLWATHDELAARNRHHDIGYPRTWNGVRIEFHLTFARLLLFLSNPRIDVRNRDVVVVR